MTPNISRSPKASADSKSLHTKFSFDQYIWMLCCDISEAAKYKHLNPQHYINAVETLLQTLTIYLELDRQFYEDWTRYNILINQKMKDLPAIDRRDYLINRYPVEIAGFLYTIMFKALGRMTDMLPKEKWRATL